MNQNEISKRLAKFPTLEKVKAGVEAILSQGWSDIKFKRSPTNYIKKFEKLFLKNIGILPYLIMLSDTDKVNPICYRVRKFDKSLDPSLISEFFFPPKSIATIKRANLPKNPVFYCSPDAKTSLIETLRDNFDENDENIFFISEWIFRQGYKLNIVPFIYDNTSELNVFKHLSENVLTNFRSKLSEEEAKHYPAIVEIFKFLSRLFVYEEAHAVSSFIAHSYLYAKHNYRADIFMYPSTQAERHTINFAIHPNTVLHKMFLQKIFCIKIKQFNLLDDNKTVNINFETINTGKNDNGVIVWKPFTPDDLKDFKKLFPDFNKNSDND